MEAIGRLAGGIAHDFNNLITVIIGYAGLLAPVVMENAEAATQIHEIEKAAKRAAGLTRQLLAFSRKQALQPKVLDLNALLTELAPMLERALGEDISLHVEYGAGLQPIKADATQLQQVILNLCVNARDAMPEGGHLDIETSNVELASGIRADNYNLVPGSYVRIVVADTGCGMPPEIQSRIFEPFFTTKGPGKGSGLGLATVYGIMRQSGGAVHVNSKPGAGARFTLHFPAHGGTVPVEPPLNFRPPVYRSAAETILLVEDDDAIRELVTGILTGAGYRVIAAKSGAEGIQFALRESGSIPLLITDVVMPGMSGPDLAERLRAIRAGISVLYVSGHPDHPLFSRLPNERGTAFLQKPFQASALLAQIREMLEGNG